MRPIALATMFVAASTMVAAAASVTRSYSYFAIGGTTLEEIERELARRGPRIAEGGPRHPGATRMEFTTRVTYREGGGRCEVVDATVTVKATMMLPQWTRRQGSESGVRLIWDTLSADIRRHEESHVVIARNHARELELALRSIRGERDCQIAAARVEEINGRILAAHDRAQVEFDRIEAINFESRMLRLLRYRLERIESGRIPG